MADQFDARLHPGAGHDWSKSLTVRARKLHELSSADGVHASEASIRSKTARVGSESTISIDHSRAHSLSSYVSLIGMMGGLSANLCAETATRECSADS